MTKTTIKADVTKYKMSPEELKIHLHIQRKGGVTFNDKSKFKRKPKHKPTFD